MGAACIAPKISQTLARVHGGYTVKAPLATFQPPLFRLSLSIRASESLQRILIFFDGFVSC